MAVQRRNTKQRKLVLDAVRQSYNHPTADEIYNVVREQDDKISRGTVYRNLNLLADAGEIDKAEDVASQLVIDAPDRQDVWMLCLRLAVMRHDGQAVQRVVDAIDKQHVYLSAENREKLAFWHDGEEAR